jgi:hypothetical protein
MTATIRNDGNAVPPQASGKEALNQTWVIGHGWMNKADLRLIEEENAIREAMAGDDEYQMARDSQ